MQQWNIISWQLGLLQTQRNSNMKGTGTNHLLEKTELQI